MPLPWRTLHNTVKNDQISGVDFQTAFRCIRNAYNHFAIMSEADLKAVEANECQSTLGIFGTLLRYTVRVDGKVIYNGVHS